MYTKEQLIEQIYLKVHGGKSDAQDESVYRADIEKFLAAGIPSVINEDTIERTYLKLREQTRRPHATDSESAFYTSYVVNIQFDEVRELSYVAPPSGVTRLPGDSQIGDIFPLKGTPFQKVNGYGDAVEMEELGIVLYWYERFAGADRIYMCNCPKPVEQVVLNVILDIDGLADTDTVPLPDYLLENLLKKADNFFSQQRERGKDEINDGQKMIA